MAYDLDIHLQDLKIFYHVVKEGGFMNAAAALNVQQAKVSRCVGRLEKAMGVTLLYCNMRHTRPTDTGRIVFETAKAVLGMMTQTYAEIQNRHYSKAGPVNLTVAIGFANFWLMQHLPEFMKLHPDIKIHLVIDETGVGDLVMGDTDIRICTVRAQHRERLQCELLCEYPFHIYASEAYLQRKGIPQSFEDLDHHDIVIDPDNPFMNPSHKKQLLHALLYLGRTPEIPRAPALTIDSDLALASSIAQGMGLGVMPSFFASAYPHLRRVYLPGEEAVFEKHKNQKFIIYPEFLKDSERHQTLIRFIQEKAKSLSSTECPKKTSTLHLQNP